MSLDLPKGPPIPVNERYYTRYDTPKLSDATGDKEIKGHDQCVLRHSNKLCVVCVGPSHPLVTDSSIEIKSIDFKNDKFDHSKNEVHGKRKRGGHYLLPHAALCQVTCTDLRKYILYSCISGYLVEVNDRLQENVNLLKTKPLSEGYLAILNQKVADESLKNLQKRS